MEFGVRDGESIRYLANLTGEATHWDGFDSFQGLPSSGLKTRWRAGQFDRGGKMPTVPSHVHLHKGWFNESLPPFLDAQLAARPNVGIGFLNMDADLYEQKVWIANKWMAYAHRSFLL